MEAKDMKLLNRGKPFFLSFTHLYGDPLRRGKNFNDYNRHCVHGYAPGKT